MKQNIYFVIVEVQYVCEDSACGRVESGRPTHDHKKSFSGYILGYTLANALDTYITGANNLVDVKDSKLIGTVGIAAL